MMADELHEVNANVPGLHQNPYLDPQPRCPTCNAIADVTWEAIEMEGGAPPMWVVTELQCSQFFNTPHVIAPDGKN